MSRPAGPLQQIPGIGPNMEEHLRQIGIEKVEDLVDKDPSWLYAQSCAQQASGTIDRCVLYSYRLAVYYAESAEHDPAKMQWWRWKDAE